MESKQRVLFLCTGNSARSQIAEGLLRHLADDRYEVFSAGMLPKGVHPRSVDVMREVGVDLSRHTSDNVDRYLEQEFDYVVTVCDRARDLCPVFPGSRSIHWSLNDPAAVHRSTQLEEFRRVRDQILERIQTFVSESTVVESNESGSGSEP
jgi:arsenate reductase